MRSGFRDMGAVLSRRRWIALIVFAVVAFGVVAGLVVTEREYTATTRVAVSPASGTASLPAGYSDHLGTIAAVANSRSVLESVAGNVSGRTVEQLRHEVEGEVVPGTMLIQVSVRDSNPHRAAQIANDVAQALPDFDSSGSPYAYDVAEPAVAPQNSSSPNMPLAWLAGIVLGAVLAISAAAIVDRKFRTVSEPDELSEASGMTVLGVVAKPAQPDGVAALDLDAEQFQSLRALRIAVEFASAEDPSRLLVMASATSSDPWPGWVEVNLAAVLAEVGHRVLVVNADRDGAVHPALDEPGAPGLYDVLAGTYDLEDAIVKGPGEAVDILPIGQAHLAGPSLLEMRFRGLLQDTEDSYDVVIVHAAPLTRSEDARIMALHGAMLLTVPAGRVHPRLVHRVAEHLLGIRLRVLGCVLIGVRPTRQRTRVSTSWVSRAGSLPHRMSMASGGVSPGVRHVGHSGDLEQPTIRTPSGRGD